MDGPQVARWLALDEQDQERRVERNADGRCEKVNEDEVHH